MIAMSKASKPKKISDNKVKEHQNNIGKIISKIHSRLTPPPIALDPIRSKPKRIYDPTLRSEASEGEHVPLILRQLRREGGDAWERVISFIRDFGGDAGLLSDLSVKAIGKDLNDPFQIQIKTGEKSVNIIDVGYGVSQILPIIVEIARFADPKTFVIQQPEVHLHPRAQAAFATFVVSAWLRCGHRFIIETHSDFIVDRIRTSIRDKEKLLHTDVGILFFSKEAAEATISEVALSERGEIEDPPEGYRDFFLQEEFRILGL
jgi:hypothetical protein